MNENFTSFQLAEYWPTPNILGMIRIRQCAWCRRNAEYQLIRTDVDGNTYERFVCPTHAAEWIPAETSS